jgi:DNA-binding response OmpR family regulator
MSQAARILIVDDEANIRLTLSALLQRAGYDITPAENGREAVALLERQNFDLMLVDLKMPEMDGMRVVAAARQRQPDLAIIVLTGHGSLETAVEGLHHGIFDYVLKTTEPAQVIERVKAGLAARTQQRRQRTLLDVVGAAVQELRGAPAAGSSEQAGGTGERAITVGALQLDTWRQEATLAGRTLPLTPTEFRVLLCLAEHAGTMLPYAYLVRCAQGYDADELEAGELIKPHIHHLRQKLEPDPTAPRYILNVRGKGYLLSPVGE